MTSYVYAGQEDRRYWQWENSGPAQKNRQKKEVIRGIQLPGDLYVYSLFEVRIFYSRQQ